MLLFESFENVYKRKKYFVKILTLIFYKGIAIFEKI